jgi:acetyl/propionyl-CoA carboxylase alpha subunit
MRVAYNDADVLEGFLLSKNEAMSSFGDDRNIIIITIIIINK